MCFCVRYFRNRLWKREQLTLASIFSWIVLNLWVILMSITAASSIQQEWSIFISIVIYGEKVLSVLYVIICSIFQLQILSHFEYSSYHSKIILWTVFINICHIGFKCVLWIYYPFFVEYVTVWISLQIINTLITKSVIHHFNEYWDDDKLKISKLEINSSQSDCYHFKQCISLFSLYRDNILALYGPKDTLNTSDKTQRLVKYILFHLSLVIQLLILKTGIMLHCKGGFDLERTESCKTEIDNMINDLMECVNTDLVDYHNQGYIDSPHFTDPEVIIPQNEEEMEQDKEEIEPDFDLERLLITPNKYSLGGIFVMTMIYMSLHFAFWSEIQGGLLVLLFCILIIIGGFGATYWAMAADEVGWEMENWRNWLWRPEESECQRWCVRNCDAIPVFCSIRKKNKIRMSCSTFWKLYVIIQCLRLQGFGVQGYEQWSKGYMRPSKGFSVKYMTLSRYQKMLLVNYELFLPIYFSWHIISTAFNDNFTISRIVINHLYGSTQFIFNDIEILKPLEDTDTFVERLQELHNKQIHQFCQVYDEICEDYEVDISSD